MVQKLTEAIDEAYHIGDTLIFLREYPAENVAMDGRIQSENPKILEAMKKDQRRSLVLFSACGSRLRPGSAWALI